MKLRIIIAGALLPLFAACSTIGTLGENETRNKIYSGTVRQWELGCAHGTCLDFPFSLVADTLLLPFTIPWTVVNLSNEGEAEPKKANP